MTNTMFAMLNAPEIVLIFAVVLVLFGAKRLPELARGLGQGIKEFKKAANDVTDDFHEAMNQPPQTPSAPKQIQSNPAPAPSIKHEEHPENTPAKNA